MLDYSVARFDCSSWASEAELCADFKAGLHMPDYTGLGFDAINDSLSEIDVPDDTGLMVALDNFSEAHRADVLLDVLANASRRWLLFGRIFGVLIRTDDERYHGPLLAARLPTGTTASGWTLSAVSDATGACRPVLVLVQPGTGCVPPLSAAFGH